MDETVAAEQKQAKQSKANTSQAIFSGCIVNTSYKAGKMASLPDTAPSIDPSLPSSAHEFLQVTRHLLPMSRV